jgi:hypothetical protein
MKRFLILLSIAFFFSCKNKSTIPADMGYTEDAVNAVLVDADELRTFPFVNTRVDNIKKAIASTIPILLLTDSVNAQQQLAQNTAIKDSAFTNTFWTKKPGSHYETKYLIFFLQGKAIWVV